MNSPIDWVVHVTPVWPIVVVVADHLSVAAAVVDCLNVVADDFVVAVV